MGLDGERGRAKRERNLRLLRRDPVQVLVRVQAQKPGPGGPVHHCVPGGGKIVHPGKVKQNIRPAACQLPAAENIQDAESTIRDTDVAEEMMSYTKNNILIQSAQAMLPDCGYRL